MRGNNKETSAIPSKRRALGWSFILVCGLVALVPAAVASGLPTGTKVTQNGNEVCIVVYDFPDAGLTYCIDPDGPCFVREIRTTFIGTDERCLLPP